MVSVMCGKAAQLVYSMGVALATPALNSTLGSSGTLVATDSSAIVTIGIGSQSVAPFATGTTIELMRALC